MHTTAYLGIGSNLGNRLVNITAAIELLRSWPRISVERCSSIYETPPYGGPRHQPDYLNAAVEIETSASPFDVLSIAKSVERSLKRAPTLRWGARTIDIDVLLFGDLVLSSTMLTIPHPLLHQRIFAVKPLAEISPGLTHPLLNVSMERLCGRLRAHKIKVYQAS